jgi:phage-related protein (TIGR01555 family)
VTEIILPPHLRSDSVTAALSASLLRNSATGVGLSSHDSITQARVGHVRLLAEDEIRSLFRGSWLIRRFIEAPAADMTKAGIELVIGEGGDDDIASKALKVYRDGTQNANPYSRRRSCGESFRQAEVWAREFGRAYVVMRVNGGEDPSKPLTRVKSFEGLSVLDRYSLRPAVGSMNMSEPEHYQVARSEETRLLVTTEKGYGLHQRIHESRVLIFDGAMIHPYDLQEDGWGGHDSVIQAVYETFMRHGMAKAAIAKGLDSYSLFKTAIKDLGTLLQADGGQAALTEYLNSVALQMSTHRIVVQDADASNSDFQERSFAGVAENFQFFIDELTAATGLPHYKIWGSVAKAGLADSGGAETRAWAEHVKAMQWSKFGDNHRRLFHAIFEALDELPEQWELEYPSIYESTPKEKEEIAKLKADRYVALVREQVITGTQAYQALATGQELESVLEPLDESDVLTIVDAAEAEGPSAEEELQALLSGDAPAGDAPAIAPVAGEVAVEPDSGAEPPPVEADPVAEVDALVQQTDSADEVMEYLLGWRVDAPKGGGKGKAKGKRGKPNCTKGRSCGRSCVARTKQCRADLSPAALTVAKSVTGGGGAGGTGGAKAPQPQAEADPFAPSTNPLPRRQPQQQQAATNQPAQNAPTKATTPSSYTPPSRTQGLKQFEELGRGGFGIVVLDRANNVAIKYSTSKGGAVSKQEMAMMQKASELGVGPRMLNDNPKALAMQYLDGYKTFKDVQSIQDLGLDGQKQMAKNFLQQVEKLQSANITHGDLYAGNIMFNPETLDVKIIDYGLSRQTKSRVTGSDFGHIRNSFGSKTFELYDDVETAFQAIKHPSVDAVLAKLEKGVSASERPQLFREMYDAIDKIDSLPTFDYSDELDDDF